jgi:hypothetical protein
MKKDRVVLEKSLVGYDKEIAALQAKYDVDKQRWLVLKAMPAKAREDASGAAGTATAVTR